MIANWNKIINSASLSEVNKTQNIQEYVKRKDYNRDTKLTKVASPSIGHKTKQVKKANDTHPRWMQSIIAPHSIEAKVDRIERLCLEILNK
jgi:hypothetical protein